MLEKQVESDQPKRNRSPKNKTKSLRRTGMRIERYFTEAGSSPYELVEWESRDAIIQGFDGEKVFEQKGVSFPKAWSVTATNVVVQKYFRGAIGTSERETSVKQMISRVVDTITGWGKATSYFATPVDAESFADELTYLLLNQHAAFNSPVWFNVGVEDHPQCSACFINSVEDTMESILQLAKTEGMLFKWGSGTGTNLSPLRSSKEQLNGGGEASGPVSFMRGYDAFAGVIKSGGKTRRAAKMVILDIAHPDIVEFVNCKSKEEKKAWALIDAGYDGSFTGEAYGSVFFQNSNNSVRVTDEFMQAVIDDKQWELRSVSTDDVVAEMSARELMRQICAAAHQCGDPGLQFDTTINDWHTCANTDRINASNPCSEYMFLDDTACNLASLNLRKFQNEAGEFNVDAFKRAVGILILAQEMVVDNAKYPTPRITENSHKYRPLGLGYANLGALLMSRGLPYDSDAGRAYAAAITSLMHGEANRVSALIAADRGTFEGYPENEQPMLRVMENHRKAIKNIDSAYVAYDLMEATKTTWDEAVSLGHDHGYRNAQVTVLAPTGTIGFMMDCDTTGVEPDIALVKFKTLVGGGMLKIVNQTVPEALGHLGYGENIDSIINHIEENGTIEGAPLFKDEHLPVFDCAFPAKAGGRSIDYMGHIRMMSAVQPFLSGAISKTVNLPNDCTPEDIQDAYMQSWQLGLKAVAVYRDGCKRSQPLSTKASKDGKSGALVPNSLNQAPKEEVEAKGPPQAIRHRLPSERRSLTHKFNIGGHEGYLTVGMYEDGRPGEIFIVMAKQGSTISGLVDSFATSVSLALQHGVPIRILVDKFAHTRFEPSGFSDNPQIGYAKSIMDYMFRWLELKFPNGRYGEQQTLPGIEVQQQQTSSDPILNSTTNVNVNVMAQAAVLPFVAEADAPLCSDCGSIMVRSGACHKCMVCGSTSGCS